MAVTDRLQRLLSLRPTLRGPEELEFLPAALEIVETPASPAGRAIMLAICFFFLAALTWAWFSHVDIIVTAQGKIIASGRTKVIQPLEIGVVRAVRVAEGDHVRAGDVLVEIDDTNSSADIIRWQAARRRAQLDNARLSALLGLSAEDPFAALEQLYPAQAAAARAQMEAQRSEQKAKIDKFDHWLVQKRAELGQVQAAIAKIDEMMPLVNERAQIRRSMLANQFGSRYLYLDAQQQVVELTNERVLQSRKLAEKTAEIEALERQKVEAQAEFSKSLRADLAKAGQDLVEAGTELAKAEQRQRAQTLTAPVDGVVTQLAVHTIGAVVTPAQQLMMLVPLDGPLEIEAVIGNKDVGFVEAGQPTEVKVEAFTFTRYGLLHGLVREVSTDAVPEPRAEANGAGTGTRSPGDEPTEVARSSQLVYVSHITLEQTSMVINGRQMPLVPGMAVTAEIKTGDRRVLDYLLSPLRQHAHDGLRER